MIDLRRNIDDVTFKSYRNEYEKEALYYIITVTKKLIFPSLLYAVYIHILIVNGLDVKFGYRSITIPIFILFNLTLVSNYIRFIPMVIAQKQRSKIISKVNINNTNYANKWKENILMLNSYVNLYDLVIAIRYKLLSIKEYQYIKSRFINQYLNVIESTKAKLVYIDTTSVQEHFNKYKQSNLDNFSFKTIVELRKSLEISDEEFEILKANFINNHALSDLNDLESLKRLEFINETEYYKKLYNQEKQLKSKLLWERSISNWNLIICIITGIITFVASK